VLVRLRFSEFNPGQVTGYSVALPGHDGADGTPLWYGGGRLSAGLTLPRLRSRWNPSRSTPADRRGAFRCTDPERNAIFEHAARQAARPRSTSGVPPAPIRPAQRMQPGRRPTPDVVDTAAGLLKACSAMRYRGYPGCHDAQNPVGKGRCHAQGFTS
jgi:hypothetical protein